MVILETKTAIVQRADIMQENKSKTIYATVLKAKQKSERVQSFVLYVGLRSAE